MWLHLPEAAVGQLKDHHVLLGRHQLNVLIRLKVPQPEEQSDDGVDEEFGQLEGESLDVRVLVEEGGQRAGDGVDHGEGRAHDPEAVVDDQLLPQLHVNGARPLVTQVVPRDETTDFAAPATQQFNVV